MVCRRCGAAIPSQEHVALLVCPICGLAHELVDGELGVTTPLVAAPTTQLAVTGETHLLAAWRLIVEVDEPGDSTWEQLARAAAPGLPYLYIPAFSTTRSVLHKLGFRLTQAQPELMSAASGLSSRGGLSAVPSPVTELVPHPDRDDGAAGWDDASGFGYFSPVVLSRQDARVLSHFLYLVLRSGDIRELAVADYRLDVVAEELVYIPAVWDTRCIHEANWRLLLHEFDDLVA